jgi:programmed cell death protein 4
MYDDPIACGEGDPNYEDPFEYDDAYFAQGMSVYRFTDNRIQLGNSKITLTMYKQSVEPIIKEYFVSGDVDNLLDCIHELEATEYGYELVKRSINMSFDQGDREREMVSRMLSTAYPDTLSSSMIGKGFERLFELVDEIEKDCPNAREMITTFLARAVIDEVVPPSFLADPVVCNLGGDVVAHAKRMLSRDHAGAQLERIWGPGDGRPVADLKIATDHLLQEYLGSGLKDEAARCVKQLAAPYFHHEIVKRAIVCALDRSVEQRQSMSALLEYLVKEEMVSQAQATKGFRRIYGIISDLILDTPNAPSLVNEFTQRAIEAEVLPHTCKELMTGDTQCADE